jgi:hypothetical protein
MKVGINVKINLSKVDKSKLYKGAKGVYLNMTTFVDLDEEDKYGNNGFISMEQSKEQRDAGEESVILGNVKKFWSDEAVEELDFDMGDTAKELDFDIGDTASAPQPDMSLEDLDSDIPF